MNNKIVVTGTTSTYASLKSKEEKLLAELKELREEITVAENGIVEEKLNSAIQSLVDVEEMTGGYYNFTVEKYCGGCEDYTDIDFDLSEIINMLKSLR